MTEAEVRTVHIESLYGALKTRDFENRFLSSRQP
jgi:hypothetical protein